MKSLPKQLGLKVLRSLNYLKYSLKQPKLKQFIHQNVPYYAQWESPQLVSQILAGKIKAEDDPLWKKSGAKDKLEYLNWSWSGCGMACLKMALEYLIRKKVPLVTLGKECLKYGGYTLNKEAYQKGDYLHSLPGLFYYPFIKFIAQEYHLSAKVVSSLTIPHIIYELSQRNLVMTSVNWAIRQPKSTPLKKGGHLVLVVGYDLISKKLIFHNPSGHSKSTQEYTQINFTNFNKFFNNKGIILYHL